MLKFVLSDEPGTDHRQFINRGKCTLERTSLLCRSKNDYNLGIASLEKKAASGKTLKKL